jgi:hypothetical protein
MATRFPAGLNDVKAAEFHTYKIAALTESDLNLIVQKCLEILGAGAGGLGFDAAKAMLDVISSEKNLRAAKSSRRAMLAWSVVTVLALLLVGILQAYVIYSTSYAPADDDDQNSCEQNQEYSV